MKLHSLNTGYFKLDGGAMFGLIPKSLWENKNPPDEKNRCTWALRTLLIQTPNGRNILVDTGIGNKQEGKFLEHFEPHEQQVFDDLLEPIGLTREDITDVFFTHLHFDHCGGALMKNEEGEIEITFPNADHWTNKRHWAWATTPNVKEKASFLKENFMMLKEQDKLKYVDYKQNIEFDDNIRVLFFNGHTDAQMALQIMLPNGQEVVYCADALPAQWYVGLPWIMAYDIRPMQTLKEKKQLLKSAVRRNQILFLEHDPLIEAIMLDKNEDGKIIVSQGGFLNDLIDWEEVEEAQERINIAKAEEEAMAAAQKEAQERYEAESNEEEANDVEEEDVEENDDDADDIEENDED